MSEQGYYSDEFPLEEVLEGLLFVATSGVTVSQLAEALEVEIDEIRTALKRLEQSYGSRQGLRLQWHAGRVQMTTSPELSPLIERFLGLEAIARLSRAALETLAIVAFKQPVTRPSVDAIRGVNSDGVIKNLLSKGLLEEIGRSEGPGRPILYGTTADFLQHFGISSLEDLPDLEDGKESEEPVKKNGVLKD
jgi:segregation and condensation protein B